jgi:hypothetical protein
LFFLYTILCHDAYTEHAVKDRTTLVKYESS